MVAELTPEAILNEDQSVTANTISSKYKVEHLDYTYIGKCSDVKYLEILLKVLRSGKEGLFPDLIEFTENRLRNVAPTSRLLNKPQPIKTKSTAKAEEFQEVADDLCSFVKHMKLEESSLNEEISVSKSGEKDPYKLHEPPPVRGTDCVIGGPESNGRDDSNSKDSNRIRSGDYRAWDKFDVDAECEKIEKEIEEEKNKNKEKYSGPKKLPSDEVNVKNIPDVEVERRALLEKEKGNESFKANDFDEAIVYYTRSLKFVETAAVYNNRCLAHLKKENWDLTLEDAEKVLQLEPSNLKAILRRSQAYLGMKDYNNARNGIETVLSIDPDNKSALKVKKEIDKKCPPPAPGAKRLLIEECDEDDDDEEPAKEDCEVKLDNQSHHNIRNDSSQPDVTTKVFETAGGSKETSSSHVQNQPKEEANTAVNNKSTFDCASSPVKVNGSCNDTGNNEIWDSNEVNEEEDEYYDCSAKTPVPSPPMFLQETTVNASHLHSTHQEAPPLKPATRFIGEDVMCRKDAANKHYHNGQYHEAMLEYSNAIDLMSTEDRLYFVTAYSSLWANRAACFVKMGDLKQAILDCEQAFSIDSTNAKVLLRRSACYQGLERYKESFVDLQKAIELNPSLLKTVQTQYNQLKHCLIKEYGPKCFTDDLPQFNTYSVESPTEKFNRLKLEGNNCVKNKDFKNAIKLYSECIGVDSRKAVAFANRAQCYMSLNDFINAENDCNTALDLLDRDKDAEGVAVGSESDLRTKVFYRRCLARKNLEKYRSAMDDLTKVMKAQQSKNMEPYRKLFNELMQLHKQQQQQQHQSGDSIKDGSGGDLGVKPSLKKVKIVEVDDDDEDEEKENESESDKENAEQIPKKMPKTIDTENKLDTNLSSVNVSTNQMPPPKEAWVSGDTTKCSSSGDEIKLEPKRDPLKKVERKAHTCPILSSQSPFEFTQAWMSIKPFGDTKLYAQLLDQIEDLSQVITVKCDAEMLSTLFKVLHDEFLSREQDCLKHLENISKIPRLSFLTMFLTDDDKAVLKHIFNSLSKACEQNGNSSDHISSRVKLLQKKYKL